MSTNNRNWLSLLAALAIPQIAGGVGAAATASSVTTWYRQLKRPAWNPPGWLFGPVWTLLYLAMGLASWLVWRRGREENRPVRAELGLYGAQLGLNVLWSVLFFGRRRIDWALAEIGLLWAAILATLASFYRVRPAAGLLLLPYQLWTTFAAALNAALWRLNRDEPGSSAG